MKKPSVWKAMATTRCPHCRQGDVFQSFLKMYQNCSICQIKYEREHGYFLVSIFFGYVLYGLLFVPIALFFYFTDRMMDALIPLGIATVLLAPFIFRYARIIWLHVDEALDPRR